MKPLFNDMIEHDTRHAAELLHAKLPGQDAVYWRWFLTNNRRNDRKASYRLRFRRAGRTVVYNINDLIAFADRVKKRRTETARPDEISPRPKKSEYSWEVSSRHVAEGGVASITMKVTGFTFSLSLEPAQARELAEQLLRHADRLVGRKMQPRRQALVDVAPRTFPEVKPGSPDGE